MPDSRSSTWGSTSAHSLGRSSPANWPRGWTGIWDSRAPESAWLWVKLGPRQPSSPAKFALALLFVGLAFVLLMPAGAIAQGGVKINPLWLVAVYFIEELGELCLSPVGLSVVTKLAPRQVVGLMMGVFFLSNALGNKLAGWSAGFISTTPLPTLFGVTAAVTLGAA